MDPSVDLPLLNTIMSMYSVSLANGETLICKQIKASTIRAYLLAAATFIRLFDSDPHRDARFPPGTNTICPKISAVLQHVERYEKVKDKKEPYTLAMQKEFHYQTKHIRDTHPDSLHVALYEWFGVALQGGNRRIEWCQPSTFRSLNAYELNGYKQAYAFTLNDIRFFTKQKQPLSLEQVLRSPASAHLATVTYRWQKNSDHGETKTYTRNLLNPACDSVGHLINICARFVRLVGRARTDLPLAVYKTRSGRVFFINSDDATTVMRSLARTVYNITSPQTLRQWTCHSLRVGACCILWAHSKNGDFIQRALRWRSDAWKDYIRDLTVHSDQHNMAMADAWNLPTF